MFVQHCKLFVNGNVNVFCCIDGLLMFYFCCMFVATEANFVSFILLSSEIDNTVTLVAIYQVYLG